MNYYDEDILLEEGALCLDFTNTLDWHASQNPVETLPDYAALVRWAQEKRILDPGEADRLIAAAGRDTSQAGKAYQDALDVREALYRIFAGAARGSQPEPGDLHTLETWAAEMLPKRRLETQGSSLKYTWQPVQEFTDLLGPIIVSALNLATSPQIHRVGQCADDRGCGWLFLDLSRNRSRQWCSMESCGNRAKALRHYHRARQAA